MKLLRLLLSIPLFGAALTGCIKEDRDHCLPDQNVRLIIQFEAQDRSAVDHLDVLLYDGDRKFMERIHILASELTVTGEYYLTLPAGEYHVVAWANADANSAYCDLVKGETLFEDCTLEIPEASTRTGDAIYYAPKREKPGTRAGSRAAGDMTLYNLSVPEVGSVTKPMPFTRAHRTINVYVKGLNDPAGITVEAHNLWKSYDFYFSNLDQKCSLTQQTAPTERNGITYEHAGFHSGYGPIEPDMEVVVIPGSNPVMKTTVNLEEFIRDNNLTELDIINILIEYGDLGVTVSVPTWPIKPIEPGQ